jgi:hypothetical protein
MSLPAATRENPACGACGRETEFDGDDFACYECQLTFDPSYLEASFLDPEQPVCGEPCSNYWHTDEAKLRPGHHYVCATCELPKGHGSEHWTDCQVVPVSPGSGTDAPEGIEQ